MKKKKTNFNIVQLSDLHLTPNNEAERSEPKLFGGLTGMNERFKKMLCTPVIQKADLILVTGDVTDRGDKETWNLFWDIVAENKLSKKIRIIPGNHDVSCLGIRSPKDWFNPKGRIFSDRMRLTRGLKKGKQETSFPWCETFFRKKIAIFGLNSNHVGGIWGADCAVGAFNKNQLSNLDKLLKENEKVPSKIILVHHSPHIPKGEKEEWGLEMPKEDREELQKICLKNNVKLILHGHLHRNMNRNLNSIKIIGAPASTEPIKGKEVVEVYSFNINLSSNRITSKLNEINLNF